MVHGTGSWKTNAKNLICSLMDGGSQKPMQAAGILFHQSAFTYEAY